MKQVCLAFLLFIGFDGYSQTIFIGDAMTKEPVSFATISFGDGRGTFAGEEGELVFNPEKYADIDTLFISAIGYRELKLSTTHLTDTILLFPNTNQLKAVVLTAENKGKYKKKKRKPTTHTDYFNCWLPTVESEVAVFFDRAMGKSSKIAKLYIPINAEKKYRKSGNRTYSTMFRVQFYENENGFPGAAIAYEDIVFIVSEQNDEVFELNLSSRNIFIPEQGVFAAIQVLGYTDSKGKLIQSKKYREVATRRGIQKISTTFRPLLPFSDKLSSQKTFVRRVFFNNKKWQVFDETYNENSDLVKNGAVNYGLGALLHVYNK